MLDFATAWDAYRRYERWLPVPPGAVCTHRVADLASLLDGPLAGAVDALLFDAYGVLSCGERPIPGAAPAFAAARERGLATVIVTNDASGDREGIAAKHRRRGFAVRGDDVVAGVDLLDEVLAREPAAARFGYLGPSPRPCLRVTAALMALPVPAAELDALEGFVLLESPAWDAHMQAALCRTLAARPRAIYVCNPDIVAPGAGGLSLEPGYHVLELAERTGIQPCLLGKPAAGVYRQALARLGHPQPGRVLAIGDSLHTDVLGARSAGMRTLLVGSGLLHGEDLGRRIDECGITPDFVAPHI